jgi:hypothetical protein
MNDFVHGEPSWRLSHDRVRLWLTIRGGHMAPVEFKLGERTVSPYALAPWSAEEADAALPGLLGVLRGDFLCFPFGGQKDAPPHGVSANAEWKVVAGGDDRLHVGMDDPDSGGWLEKIVLLREGETAVYCEHRISGVSGRYSYGNHPILDFAGLGEGEARVSVSAFRWASVYPGLFSNPENREYGALEPGGEFSDLSEVPLANGGTTDLTCYPARQGFDDGAALRLVGGGLRWLHLVLVEESLRFPRDPVLDLQRRPPRRSVEWLALRAARHRGSLLAFLRWRRCVPRGPVGGERHPDDPGFP